jgi:hypothetical protein
MAKRVRRAQPPPVEPGNLLDRILSAPHLARAVPQLPAKVLHRVIQHCGLADCADLVALATPGQLARVFDLDLWRPAAPGLDEQFDARRFGAWLEVMVDAGGPSAASMLAAMDANLLAVGLIEHVRVFDSAAVAPFVTLDGDVSPGARFADGVRCEVAGYVVCAKRVEFWETITAVLNAMAETHGDAFNTIMRECCRLSKSRPEIDGLDDVLTTNEQAMFDAALDREARRDTEGYVTPAQARAFLQASRRIDLRHGAVPPRDQITRAHFRSVDRAEPAEQAPPDALSAIVDLLREAGVMPEGRHARRALLEGPQAGAPRLGRIRAHLLFTHDHNPNAYATRSDELAYLANVIAAGSTVQSRSVAAEDASKAAVAVCNLGLENWPLQRLADGALPEDFLTDHDLVSVFQVGWTILHEDVCMYAADALISVLASLHCADNDFHAGLATLRMRLIKHWRAGSPWQARDGLDVIAMLDAPAWAALHGLIDQFPTLHGAVGALLAGTSRQIDASAFEFISENAQIQQVRDFMQRLPQLLCS